MKVLIVAMEAAFQSDIPTYAGGLGVLVGDKLKAAKDLGIEMHVITFSYPQGYVRHAFQNGDVLSLPNPYAPEKLFKTWDEREVLLGNEKIHIKILNRENVWLIHTDLAKRVYIEKDPMERIKKEVLLGKIASQFFFDMDFDVLHVEESHGAFAAYEVRRKDKKKRVVFTTHTPLPYAHEIWNGDIVGRFYPELGTVNMTKLAMKNADFVNCVSKMQSMVMKDFLEGRGDYITNGVHWSWINRFLLKELRRCGFKSPEDLVYASSLELSDIAEAKIKAKEELISEINANAIKNQEFDADNFTIGIGRRFSPYKRVDMLISQLFRIESLASNKPLQIVFAGVSHPADRGGIEMVKKVVGAIKKARYAKIAYFPYYTTNLAKRIIAGSDVWINVPKEEQEACGTSWMKAMLNGSVLISTLAGGVPEFAINNQNALLIEQGLEGEQIRELFSHIKQALYAYYDSPRFFYEIARSAIATGSLLSARRMLLEYIAKAYGK